nr:hypothetical protein [Morchella crassipes]
MSLPLRRPTAPRPLHSPHNMQGGGGKKGGGEAAIKIIKWSLPRPPSTPRITCREGGGKKGEGGVILIIKWPPPSPPPVLFNFHYIISLYNESKFSILWKLVLPFRQN